MKNKRICLILLFVFVFVLFLCGCSDPSPNGGIDDDGIDEDKVQFVIDLIDEFDGKVTLRRKDDVSYANQMYNDLNDEEKALVTNYENLVYANNFINYLENENSYIVLGIEECKRYLETIIPEVIDKDNFTLDFPMFYDYKNDYSEYTFVLKWSSDNLRYINEVGEVYHTSEDRNVNVKCNITCLKLSDNYEFNKTVKIEKLERKFNDKQLVVSYFYGKFNGLNDIDYDTIDIINYSFAQIAKRSEAGNDVYYIDVSGASSINTISEVHRKGVKVCLSLGGWHTDLTFWNTYSEASSTEENRKQVANAILEVMEKYQLDGIDLDWEYPKAKDKDNFTLLMKEIYDTLKAKDEGYLISAAVPCGEWATERYNYTELNKYMDYFYIMTYDLDDDGSGVVKHLTNLSTAKVGANVLLNRKVDSRKIVIGIAFYARKYTGIENPKTAIGTKYETRSTIKYDTVVNDYLSRLGGDVVEYYDSSALAYYLYDTKNKVVISFDNAASVNDKYNYTIQKNLGGVMYWSYQDDPTGTLMQVLNGVKLK
ncbi:MAG: glycoside hydrolase family 18 protein [Bacilli bacterium]|nr:glycoside hydrolase family 18 protein [Bacilli bacterium]